MQGNHSNKSNYFENNSPQIGMWTLGLKEPVIQGSYSNERNFYVRLYTYLSYQYGQLTIFYVHQMLAQNLGTGILIIKRPSGIKLASMARPLFPLPPPPPIFPPLRLRALLISDCQLPEPPLLTELGVVHSHHHPGSVHGNSRPQEREELLSRLTFILRAQMLIWKLPNIQFFDHFLTLFLTSMH